MWDAHDVRHARWETVVQVSAGYFLYDLALVLFCMPELSGRWGTIAHHVIALVLHWVPVWCPPPTPIPLPVVLSAVHMSVLPQPRTAAMPARSGFQGFVGPSMLGYLAELSTPLLNLRWFLFKLDRADGTLYLANGVLLIVVFFGCLHCAFGLPVPS